MLLACSLFITAFAQPVIERQKDLGGNNLDFFTCVALTNDGGRIVGGYSRSNISGQKTDTRDRKSTRLNSSHVLTSRMPSSA